MAPAARAPRMSQFVVALCVSLRLAGKSLRQIASHRLVKKRDGTHPTQQSVAEAVQNHKTQRRSAIWRLKKSPGRPNKLTEAQVKAMDGLIKKNPGVVRAPYLKRKLKLTCHRRTIQRAVAKLGYTVCRRGSKKVLSRTTKKRRLSPAPRPPPTPTGNWDGPDDSEGVDSVRELGRLANHPSVGGWVAQRIGQQTAGSAVYNPANPS